MLFTASQQQLIASGRLTRTFRAWKSARVRAGRVYSLGGGGCVAVEAVTRVVTGAIAAEAALAAGFATVDALIRELRRVTGKPISPGDELYEVKFRYEEGQREGPVHDLTAEQAAARLARMDAQSASGPWTVQALAAIRDRPRVSARELAADAGRERLAFKAGVRKLKALGLTISHEVGYELTPAGRDVLALLAPP